jgi:hypothetical protein
LDLRTLDAQIDLAGFTLDGPAPKSGALSLADALERLPVATFAATSGG